MPRIIPTVLPPLRDRIRADVRVLFVGINPGIRSSLTGHHFAGFSNRFWKLLFESRLVPERIRCEDDDRLPEWRYGVTNIVPRPTPGIDTLRPEEYVAGRARLRRKVLRYRPEVVALVGVTVFRALFPDRTGVVTLGLQPETIGGSALFVLPNPSGRNANFTHPEMLAAYRALRRYVRRRQFCDRKFRRDSSIGAQSRLKGGNSPILRGHIGCCPCGMRRRSPLLRIVIALLLAVGPQPASAQLLGQLLTVISPVSKLDPLTEQRLAVIGGHSRIIVRAVDLGALSSLGQIIADVGGTIVRTLPLISSQVADVPNLSLLTLAASPLVERISLDRRAVGTLERTGAATGAAGIREELKYDGAGVGVAVIDSGVTSWHDDLAAPGGGQRVEHFVDFVRGWSSAYDDYGHGSHVAGIIAGDGFDSSGARAGIAPAARLIVLKVLDGSGGGYISDVIAALEYAVEHRTQFNIRVVNLSVAAGVHESYNTDPLTLAARRAVEAGIVVVAAAGNGGRNPDGRQAYGGVTAPGNAPWVLTVGAASHMGTLARTDDTMARFSSRGPSRIDHGAKPDVVAPGVGIESLSDPDSAFYSSKSAYLLPGTAPTPYLPYLSLSGTSMAAPVVSGTIALMLQANPALTPNLAKAILQFTAEVYGEYDTLTQGAGFLNARGAVELARYFATSSTADVSSREGWSRRLIWGNRLVQGGWLTTHANAWRTDTVWGRTKTAGGDAVKWGVICSGSSCGSWQPWQMSTGSPRNVVWGSACNGADCQGSWTLEAVSDDDESVVWGTTDPDESVVWGTSGDDESVVWGTNCADAACEPVVWRAP